MSLSAFGTLPAGVLAAPVPYTISVPSAQQNQLTKLVRQAAIGVPTYYNTHTDTTTANATSYGLSRDWLVHAQDVWTSSSHEYSWCEEQKRLNRYPHFRVNVTTSTTPSASSTGDGDGGSDTKETFDLHFTGLFSRNATATPVLLMHGWPGSWFEFAPMLDLLAAKYTPETLPYQIVVPSLPDYGLSTRRGELGRELSRYGAAAAMDGLMGALGFGGGYVVQGGDLGSIVAQELCGTFEGCKAVHLNLYFMSAEQRAAVADIPITPDEQARLALAAAWDATGRAYATEHSTRPATIALALSTNPLALLAWVGEKFIEWSDNRYPLSLNTILSMASFYWFTDSFGRGMWGYSLAGGALPSLVTSKPFGFSSYLREIASVPRAWAEHLFPNLVFYKAHDRGGHFAALEQPELFLQDLEEFVAIVAQNVTGSH